MGDSCLQLRPAAASCAVAEAVACSAVLAAAAPLAAQSLWTNSMFGPKHISRVKNSEMLARSRVLRRRGRFGSQRVLRCRSRSGSSRAPARSASCTPAAVRAGGPAVALPCPSPRSPLSLLSFLSSCLASLSNRCASSNLLSHLSKGADCGCGWYLIEVREEQKDKRTFVTPTIPGTPPRCRRSSSPPHGPSWGPPHGALRPVFFSGDVHAGVGRAGRDGRHRHRRLAHHLPLRRESGSPPARCTLFSAPRCRHRLCSCPAFPPCPYPQNNQVGTQPPSPLLPTYRPPSHRPRPPAGRRRPERAVLAELKAHHHPALVRRPQQQLARRVPLPPPFSSSSAFRCMLTGPPLPVDWPSAGL